MKKYLEILIIPIVYIIFALCIGYTWKFLHLPSPEVFIPIMKEYFDQYGILIVFLAALIESAFVVGSWVPGSVVIFMGGCIFNRKSTSSICCSFKRYHGIYYWIHRRFLFRQIRMV